MEMIPGAADQSVGMCGLPKPAETQLQEQPWAGGQWWEAGLSEMVGHTWRAAEPKARAPVNHPSSWGSVIHSTKIQHAKANWFYQMGCWSLEILDLNLGLIRFITEL